jgi:glucose-1-phosphate thymidylyltransferase
VFEVIHSLKPSARGELEITDVNRYYLTQHRLGYTPLDGYWTDAGTLDSLAHANQLVRAEPPRY